MATTSPTPSGASPIPPRGPKQWDEATIRATVPERVLKNGGGLVPVKAEFVRERTERDASAAGGPVDARLRGQNKGRAREHASVEGTGGRPTFEGETNFLFGPALGRIKAVIKSPAWDPRRDRNAEDGLEQCRQQRPQPTAGEQQQQAASPTATAAEAAAAQDTVVNADDGKADHRQEEYSAAASTDEPPVVSPVAANLTPTTATSAAPAAVERPNVLAVTIVRSDEPAEERRNRLFRDKLVLAPLTTVGNLPFRRICVDFGVDVTVGEMAMAVNLNHTQPSEWSLLRRHKSEKIFGVQIASGRGFDAARLAMLLNASEFDYDYVDINCGCPVDLIVRKGCGCGLWERKGRMREVVSSLVRGQARPVTIKCRIGPDELDPQLHKHIDEYESWGADAVTVHGRSRKQRYTKLANWAYVEECAKLTRLPVIGNGDLYSLQNYLERREIAPHVTSHMFARGALVKPWIFKEVKERTVFDISSHERLEMLRDFGDYGLAHWGSDEKGVATTRRYMCEWLSFLCRYVPVGLLEQQPQFMNDRPPFYVGRNDLETLMSSDQVSDWVKISELVLGPAGDKFKFTPKHKSNSYQSSGGESAPAADMPVEG
jgi:tRNA-dihydrouridine synthase 3